MSTENFPKPVRRPDGSIDFDYYRGRSRAMRRSEMPAAFAIMFSDMAGLTPSGPETTDWRLKEPHPQRRRRRRTGKPGWLSRMLAHALTVVRVRTVRRHPARCS